LPDNIYVSPPERGVMFHLFDNNDDKFLQILGNMALYKIPMNNKAMHEIMDEAMPVLVCIGFIVLVIVDISLLVRVISAA